MSGHTPGPWGAPYWDSNPGDRGWWIHNGKQGAAEYAVAVTFSLNPQGEADARLIAAAPELLEALYEGRRAIGDHHAPNDCYATGPMTGDEYRDLVQCPACSFIAMYDAAIAKAKGEPHA